MRHPAWLVGGLLLLLAGVVAILASARGSRSGHDHLEVFVGIPPQVHLVKRIAGDRVTTHVLVQPWQDPHTFEPTPSQIKTLGRASLFFQIGMPFEQQILERIPPDARRFVVVDTAAGISKRMTTEVCCDHAQGAHDHHGEHAQGEESAVDQEHAHLAQPDPHIWLSPALLKTQATSIAKALQAADPAHAEEYAANLARLVSELDATDSKIRRQLAPYRGQTFYVFHPAFGYFGDAYGLKQQAVEVEGKQPTPRQLRELMERAKAEQVKIIFVQPQFDQRAADVVAGAIGGTVVQVDTLSEDVPKQLEEIAAKIELALRK